MKREKGWKGYSQLVIFWDKCGTGVVAKRRQNFYDLKRNTTVNEDQLHSSKKWKLECRNINIIAYRFFLIPTHTIQKNLPNSGSYNIFLVFLNVYGCGILQHQVPST